MREAFVEEVQCQSAGSTAKAMSGTRVGQEGHVPRAECFYLGGCHATLVMCPVYSPKCFGF